MYLLIFIQVVSWSLYCKRYEYVKGGQRDSTFHVRLFLKVASNSNSWEFEFSFTTINKLIIMNTINSTSNIRSFSTLEWCLRGIYVKMPRRGCLDFSVFCIDYCVRRSSKKIVDMDMYMDMYIDMDMYMYRRKHLTVRVEPNYKRK